MKKQLLFIITAALYVFTACNNNLSAPAVTDISITPSENAIVLKEGANCQIIAKALPENAADKTLGFSSNDDTIVSVTSAGLVTAKAVGSAAITVNTVNSIQKTIRVIITAQPISPAGIVLESGENSVSIQKGSTHQIRAAVVPENATDKKLIFSSTNSTIAAVDTNGLITGKNIGSASITIKTANGKEQTVSVTVTPAPIAVSKITLSPDMPITLEKGYTQ